MRSEPCYNGFLVSALEKIPNQEIAIEPPADQAGIFLGRAVVSRTYDLLNKDGNEIYESFVKIQSLVRTGRFIGSIASPGFVTVEAYADEQGEF